jgi:hypothetical protein
MRAFLLFVGVLMLLMACQKPEGNADPQAEAAYFFSLKKYFASEIKRLEASKTLARKVVLFNDKRDETANETLNYAKELEVFLHSDINKLSWRDKYRGDTVLQQGAIQRITYTALDEQLKTRKVSIYFAHNYVAQVEIHNRLKSIIAETWQDLRYQAAKGYRISGQQNMRAAGNAKVGVEVSFVGVE